MIALASICDPAIRGSLVGGHKYPLKLQKFADALQMLTMLNELSESSSHWKNRLAGSGMLNG